eukprot:Skav231263  [mRNA]  locus=scaffold2436:74586:81781:+ [translate_table: standard]
MDASYISSGLKSDVKRHLSKRDSSSSLHALVDLDEPMSSAQSLDSRCSTGLKRGFTESTETEIATPASKRFKESSQDVDTPVPDHTQEPDEEFPWNFDDPQQEVPCIILQAREWDALVRDSCCILRPFRSREMKMCAIVKRNGRYLWVGILTLKHCLPFRSSDPEMKSSADRVYSKRDLDDFKQNRTTLWWMFDDIAQLDKPGPMQWVDHVFKNRTFTLPVARMKPRMVTSPLKLDLRETASYFLGICESSFQETIRRRVAQLSNRTIKVGTTCSGTDIAVTVMRQTLQMLNGTEASDVKLQHVFAVEKDEAKRDLILKEHPECRHVFSDVKVFADGKGHCFRCNKTHNVNPQELPIDVLVSGPSCKDLSRLNNTRIDKVGSYDRKDMDEATPFQGSSSETYTLGFRKVVEQFSPALAVYENVKAAAERSKDAKGVVHPPAVEAKGNVEAVHMHLKRDRDSMSGLLSLTTIPEMGCEDKEVEDLDDLRTRPLEGEERMIWAIQPMESDEEPPPRQPLPRWIASPLERAIVRWVEEHQVWMDKIDERHLEGKALTPSAQKQFDNWQKNSREVTMLFNKRTQSLSPAPRKNANINRLKEELFALTVHLSMDASQLLVQAGLGECKRLVALKGQENADTSILPDFVSENMGVGVEETLSKQLVDERDMPDEDADLALDEIDGREDQDKAEMEAENHVLAEGMDPDAEEVLAYTSEEEELKSFISTPFVRVKAFTHRTAYQKLNAKGLVDLPPHGVVISYHQGSRQWSGYFNGSSVGLCFSHGGSTKRSECEALLLCIKAVLTVYLEKNPRDKAWKQQLDKVRHAEASCATF